MDDPNELISSTEAARILGVSQSRMHFLRNRPNNPLPAFKLRGSHEHVYRLGDVLTQKKRADAEKAKQAGYARRGLPAVENAWETAQSLKVNE